MVWSRLSVLKLFMANQTCSHKKGRDNIHALLHRHTLTVEVKQRNSWREAQTTHTLS